MRKDLQVVIQMYRCNFKGHRDGMDPRTPLVPSNGAGISPSLIVKVGDSTTSPMPLNGPVLGSSPTTKVC